MSNPIFKFALRDDLKDQKQFLPTRGEPLASGWDVRAALPQKQLVLRPFDTAKIPLGFRGFCPEGWWYELKPRSSTFGKKNLHALYGTIDETFEGQLVFACQYLPPVNGGIYDEPESWESYIKNNQLVIEHGEAIGQIVPKLRDVMVVQEISNDEYDQLCRYRGATRGAGGFGSTDPAK